MMSDNLADEEQFTLPNKAKTLFRNVQKHSFENQFTLFFRFSILSFIVMVQSKSAVGDLYQRQ